MFSGIQDDAAAGAQSEARLGRCRTGQYPGCGVLAEREFELSKIDRAHAPGRRAVGRVGFVPVGF